MQGIACGSSRNHHFSPSPPLIYPNCRYSSILGMHLLSKCSAFSYHMLMTFYICDEHMVSKCSACSMNWTFPKHLDRLLWQCMTEQHIQLGLFWFHLLIQMKGKILEIMYLRELVEDLVEVLFDELVAWLLKIVVVDHRHLDNR